MRSVFLILPLFAACSVLPATAGEPDIGVGMVDLDALGFEPGAEPAFGLVLGSAQFDVAALAAQATDPELAGQLAAVEAFCLHQYLAPDAMAIDAAGDLLLALVADGWQLARQELQDTRQVSVYLKSEAGEIAGLTVVAIDPGLEVTIANVVGNIEPARLTSLGLPIPQ